MKKSIVFIILALFFCSVAHAQSDNESNVEADLEIEGLENIWLDISLDKVPHQEGFVAARAGGSNVAFLNHVRKFSINLVTVLFEKYPEEMFQMLGTTIAVDITFSVLTDGHVALRSISGGATLGIDPAIANKIFNSYRNWKPATLDGQPVISNRTLTIQLSL